MPSPLLSRLLVQWEESLEEGREQRPEDPAEAQPEMLPLMREGIDTLRRARRLAGSAARIPSGDATATAPGDIAAPADVPPGYELLEVLPPSGRARPAPVRSREA